MSEGPLQRTSIPAGHDAGLRKQKPDAAEPIAAAFGEYLSRELRARNWTIRALGLRSGVDHTTISRLIHGKRVPTLRTASRLSEALQGPHPGPVPSVVVGSGLGDAVERVAAALGADPSLNAPTRATILRYYVDVRTAGLSASVPPSDE